MRTLSRPMLLLLVLFVCCSELKALHAEAPLKSGVSVFAGPVPDELKPGTAFDGIKQGPAEKWGRIPNWLGGTWTANSELAESPGGPPELIEEAAEETWGAQVDSKGNIWHRFVTPLNSECETSTIKKYTYWIEFEPLRCTDDAFDFRGKSYSVDVEIRTGKVKRVLQSITLTSFAPITSTKVRRVQILNQYDEQGKVLTYGTRVCSLMSLQKPMQRDETLKRKFVRFLRDSQLTQLIPH